MMNFLCKKEPKGNLVKGLAMGMIAGGLVGMSVIVFTDPARVREVKKMCDKCVRSTKAFAGNIGL